MYDIPRDQATLDLLEQIEAIAKEHHDGHFTVFKFTTNWRVMFGTPCIDWSGVDDYIAKFDRMDVGATFVEAARNAIKNEPMRRAEEARLSAELHERLTNPTRQHPSN